MYTGIFFLFSVWHKVSFIASIVFIRLLAKLFIIVEMVNCEAKSLKLILEFPLLKSKITGAILGVNSNSTLLTNSHTETMLRNHC